MAGLRPNWALRCCPKGRSLLGIQDRP